MLGKIGHTQLIECLGSWHRTGRIALDFGQKTKDAVLVIFEHVVGEQVTHRQGKILYRNTYLVVRLVGVDGLNDTVPLLVASHEIILHHLFGFEIAVFPNEQSHEQKSVK